jgi:hypothetical protein
MRDYLAAVRAVLRAFRGEAKLQHDGPYYRLNLLPAAWSPARHNYEDVKVDASAVGPHMCRVAGELADGVHVHPMHSIPYLQNRLMPAIRQGAERAGRPAGHRPDRAGVRDSGRYPGRTGTAARPGPHADRLLRLDAELRLPAYRPRLRRRQRRSAGCHAHRRHSG